MSSMINIYAFFYDPYLGWYVESMDLKSVKRMLGFQRTDINEIEVDKMISKFGDESILIVETIDDDVYKVAERYGIELKENNVNI